MTRRAALLDAARWTMREDHGALAEAPPVAAHDVQAVLDDPALGEALTTMDGMGRLSDADIRAMRHRRRRAIGAGLSLALVAVIGIAGWTNGWYGPATPLRQHYETQRGEQRTVRLADGSTLQLDGATALDVEIDGTGRRVALQRGEAYFDVAHDPARPFEISAGGSNTRVLGTAFTLDIGSRDVKLAVYRGKVQFGSRNRLDGSIIVPAGWRSRFSGGIARYPTRFDATQQDWRQSWIDTDDLQLGELIDALNRRRGPRIVPPPPRLASIALAGRFRLDDARQLLSAMGDIYGFRVEDQDGALRLMPDGSDPKMPQN